MLDSVFNVSQYGLFGFLANVRNYSEVPFIQQSRGLPSDASESLKQFASDDGYGLGDHNLGYVTLKELLEWDYSKTFQDMRTSKTVGSFTDGAARSETGGVTITFKEFLGEWYFNELEFLRRLVDNPDDLRIVFGFDS